MVLLQRRLTTNPFSQTLLVVLDLSSPTEKDGHFHAENFFISTVNFTLFVVITECQFGGPMIFYVCPTLTLTLGATLTLKWGTREIGEMGEYIDAQTVI